MSDTEPAGSAPRAWIFQANPRQFDLEVELRGVSPGETAWWNASQHRALMRPGDVALLWASGKRSGVYAVAVLTSAPFERGAESETSEHLQPYELVSWRVEYRYLAIFSTELPRSALLADEALQELSVLRSPQGTNFPVAASLWPSLRARLLEKVSRGEGRGALDALPQTVTDERDDPPIDEHLSRRVQSLFIRDGLLRDRQVGPAIALDVVRYLRRRQGGCDALAEAIPLFVVPQLDGLDAEAAERVVAALLRSVDGAASPSALSTLRARLIEAFGVAE